MLCDVFEKFVGVFLKDYGLDPCHYFSSSGLSWDAMLKMTGIQLEKINNIDVHLFLEKGMRGGVSYISKRYSKSDENTEIIYWDANSLYRWAMIQDLPYGGFKSLSQKEINNFDLDSISENGPIGYILEVDLKYCKELHDLHSDYPLCLEKIEVNYAMLSKYCKDIADWYNIKTGGVKKLIPNLDDKIKYVVHYKNLQYYLSLEMKLIKIHRILKFKQSNWLKKYVDFNAEKRKQGQQFVRDQKTYQRCFEKPNFISQKIFHKNFVHCSKTVLTLNKPIYVGFSILELTKLLMYQFHYDYVLKTFDNVKLLLTDTDSLVYEIKGDNVYDQCFKDKHMFDLSGYPKDSIYYCDLNKKVLGKMKDELNGIKIDKFVGLKCKIYSLIAKNDKELNKEK